MAVDHESQEAPFEAQELPNIGQYVSVEEQSSQSSQAPVPKLSVPVLDVQSLAQAIVAALHSDRPENFEVINFKKSLTTTSTSYVKVVEWIPKSPGGILKEISMTNDPLANYKLVVSNREMFKDEPLSAALTLDYQRMRVPGANDKPITIWVKSTTGASITVDGLINGEQTI